MVINKLIHSVDNFINVVNTLKTGKIHTFII